MTDQKQESLYIEWCDADVGTSQESYISFLVNKIKVERSRHEKELTDLKLWLSELREVSINATKDRNNKSELALERCELSVLNNVDKIVKRVFGGEKK